MNSTVLKGYLQLARPANLPTAMADIVGGAAISGFFILQANAYFPSVVAIVPLVFLLISSVCLYGGGVILNDVFDYKLDSIERPERPLPSGLIKVKNAAIYGSGTLSIGVLFAFLVSALSGFIALGIVISVLLYDGIAKKHGFFGPLAMGVCRGLNLLLGISIIGQLSNLGYALIPIGYIFAITLISRGEVHGKNKKHIIAASLIYITVLIILLTRAWKTQFIIETLPFLLGFGYFILQPLFRAFANNTPKNIKGAVIAGVMGVVLLNAVWAATAGLWVVSLFILLLLPLSKFLSKQFAVT